MCSLRVFSLVSWWRLVRPIARSCSGPRGSSNFCASWAPLSVVERNGLVLEGWGTPSWNPLNSSGRVSAADVVGAFCWRFRSRKPPSPVAFFLARSRDADMPMSECPHRRLRRARVWWTRSRFQNTRDSDFFDHLPSSSILVVRHSFITRWSQSQCLIPRGGTREWSIQNVRLTCSLRYCASDASDSCSVSAHSM